MARLANSGLGRARQLSRAPRFRKVRRPKLVSTRTHLKLPGPPPGVVHVFPPFQFQPFQARQFPQFTGTPKPRPHFGLHFRNQPHRRQIHWFRLLLRLFRGLIGLAGLLRLGGHGGFGGRGGHRGLRRRRNRNPFRRGRNRRGPFQTARWRTRRAASLLRQKSNRQSRPQRSRGRRSLPRRRRHHAVRRRHREHTARQIAERRRWGAAGARARHRNRHGRRRR